jgi:hypothetical protein
MQSSVPAQHPDSGTSLRTRVVNVRHEACDVYIGRALRNWPASPFANPFRIGPGRSREQAIEQYRAYLAGRSELLAALEGLRGKRLGCWCAPLACHGDVLTELLEGPAPSQGTLF